MGDNADWLQKFLKRKGYLPDKSLIEQIKKTVDLMHENGMTHGDLHGRNIKISGGGHTYLILEKPEEGGKI